MKLPTFLSRLRLPGAAKASPPEPVIMPAPVLTPPARSGSEKLNHWLALGANFGVLLGLIILVVEVRQDAALTRAGMEQQKNQLLAEIEFSLAKREMAEVWVKAVRTPEALTDAEARMVESHLVALMLQWDQMFQMEDAGLISREDSRQHINNSARFYFGSQFAKNWWHLEMKGWEGTPMAEVAGPIIDGLDENFIANHLDGVRLVPVTPADAPLVEGGD